MFVDPIEYIALDRIAEECRKKDAEGKHSVTGGGDVHKAYMQWCKDNPDEIDDYRRTLMVVQAWDKASRPFIDKNKGQGVFAFYEPNANMPVDGRGGRKPFKAFTIHDLDAWWEVEEEENERSQKAHNFKGWVKDEIRRELKDPKDVVDRVMRMVFGYRDPIDQ